MNNDNVFGICITIVLVTLILSIRSCGIDYNHVTCFEKTQNKECSLDNK
jgi:hypothetical protein